MFAFAVLLLITLGNPFWQMPTESRAKATYVQLQEDCHYMRTVGLNQRAPDIYAAYVEARDLWCNVWTLQSRRITPEARFDAEEYLRTELGDAAFGAGRLPPVPPPVRRVQ